MSETGCLSCGAPLHGGPYGDMSDCLRQMNRRLDALTQRVEGPVSESKEKPVVIVGLYSLRKLARGEPAEGEYVILINGSDFPAHLFHDEPPPTPPPLKPGDVVQPKPVTVMDIGAAGFIGKYPGGTTMSFLFDELEPRR